VGGRVAPSRRRIPGRFVAAIGHLYCFLSSTVLENTIAANLQPCAACAVPVRHVKTQASLLFAASELSGKDTTESDRSTSLP
jgi:hypothetical protein